MVATEKTLLNEIDKVVALNKFHVFAASIRRIFSLGYPVITAWMDGIGKCAADQVPCP